MHWADIHAAINKSGYTLTKIAEMEGVDKSTVSLVIRGKRTSHNLAYAISAATGIPTERLWPGKYSQAPADHKAESFIAAEPLAQVANG